MLSSTEQGITEQKWNIFLLPGVSGRRGPLWGVFGLFRSSANSERCSLPPGVLLGKDYGTPRRTTTCVKVTDQTLTFDLRHFDFPTDPKLNSVAVLGSRPQFCPQAVVDVPLLGFTSTHGHLSAPTSVLPLEHLGSTWRWGP